MRNYYDSLGLKISKPKTPIANRAFPRPIHNSSSAKSLWMIMLLIAAFLAGNQKILAQSSANYTFSTATNGSLALDQNGNSVNMSSGTTQLVGPGLDAAASPVTNIGFDFFFMGNRFTQFSVQEDGILQLGGTVVGTNIYSITGGTATAPRLSAFNTDFRTGTTTGKIHYKLVGAAPNRVLVVEFTDMQLFYTSPGTAGTSTWQMRLYENGNIEYVYGAMSATDVTTGNRAPSIGFYTGSATGSFASVLYATNAISTTNPYAANPSITAIGTIPNLHSVADGSRRVYSFIPPGNTGNAIATTLAAPTALTFSNINAAGMTLNWTEATPTTGILKYAVYGSLDGINYNYVNTTLLGTNTLTVSGLTPSTNYFWKVISISEGGKSGELLGSQITNAAGNITAVASGNWSDIATWGGAIPTATDNVTIPAGIMVTEDVTAATAYSLTIAGDLVYTAATARTLTVGTNVTINAGGTFKSAESGTVTTHSLVVGGSLINNGTLDFNAFATSGALITFNTAGNANFTLGASSITNLRNTNGVTLNKGNISSVLTFTPGGTLTVQGANTSGFLTITSGLFKLDGTNAFSNPLFSANGYTIATAGGLWLNNPNATIVALGGSPTFAGLFRLTEGIYNVGTAAGNSVGFNAGSTIIIEGGVINAASRFGVGTAGNAITYTQSGGVLTLNMVGNTSTSLASWDLGTSAASVVTISGGMIYIQNANTAASGPRDVRGTTAVVPVFTGGTLQFGNAATATNFVFRMQGQVPANVIVDNTTNPKTVQLVTTTTNTIYGNLTIDSGASFDCNGLTAQVLGASVVDNGSIVGTVAGSRFDFVGSVPQAYSGAGTFGTNAVPFQGVGVGISNPNNVTLNAPIIANRFNLFSGSFINSNQITVGNGTAITTIQRGGTAAGIAGSFDVAPNFDLLTDQINLLYNASTAQITTGFEVPPTRLASLVIVNNATGVVLAGGNLETAALTLTLGIVNTSAANVLSLSGTLATSLTGGSATSYVNGPLNRAIASGNTATNFVLFPVGTAVYTPISLAPTTTSLATFKAEAFDSNTGTADPSIINLNTSRRWEAPLMTGTFTDLKVKIGDSGLVSTNIPVHATTSAGSYAASFGSTGVFATGTPNTIESILAIPSADYSGFIGYATSNACMGTPVPGNTIASSEIICLGASTILSLQNVTPGSGLVYEWESSTDGVTYAPISGAVSATYSATPNVPTFYRANVICDGNTGTSSPVQITFSNEVTASTPATRCGNGEVTLEATPSTGASINWYDAAVGGTLVGSGNTFVTPVLTATTNYWAAAETAGSPIAGGIIAPPADWTGSTLTNWGIIFDALTGLTINSVDLYSTSSGTVNLKVVNAAGTELYATGNVAIANGGVTTPNVVPINFTIPAGTGYKILVKSYTGVSLVRGSSGGLSFPYVNGNISVTASEWGGSTTSTYYYMYNIKTTGSCSSPRVPVVATVDAAPTLTLSDNPAAVCQGTPTATVTLTAGAADYDTYVWSPDAGVSGDAVAGWTFNPTATTAYTVTATHSVTGCINTATVNVTVNTTPSAIIITPDASTICEGAIQQLSATGGEFSQSVVSGTGATVSGTSATNATLGPNPLQAYYGGTKQQWIYTTAELTSLGFVANTQINAVKLDLATANTAYALNNLVVKMKNSSTASFATTTSWETGLTTVKAASSYTPVVGVNTFMLDTPFTWNGTDNLIIEMNYSNNNGGTTAAYNTAKHSTTAFVSTIFYRADNQTATAVNDFVGTANYTYSARTDVTFDLSSPAPVTWSSTGTGDLFTDASATIPYVSGDAASTVYAKPSATATYTAIATLGTCSSTATSVITVTEPTVAPDFAAIGSICEGSTAPALELTSPNGITGTWSPATVSNTADGTYVFTPDAGQCAVSQTLNVTVTAAAPTPTGDSPQTGTTLADLVVSPTTGINWYASEADALAGTNALPLTTVLVDGATYYATQDGTCESLSLAVTIDFSLATPSFNFNSLKYYPNPVTDILTVNFTEAITGIKLYNMVGQQLMVKTVNAREAQLDMSHLPMGTYLLEVSVGNTSKMVKLMKN